MLAKPQRIMWKGRTDTIYIFFNYLLKPDISIALVKNYMTFPFHITPKNTGFHEHDVLIMGLIQPHYRISSYNQLAGLRIASG
jgi:hypothetical protein